MHKFLNKVFVIPHANDFAAYNPEVWAQESLMILEKNLVMANLVHRDFENAIASSGDVVNTRAPASYAFTRKGDSDDVTIQDGTATNVAVKLNQHGHVSFLIRDAEQAKSFKDLVNENLRPAMIAMAQGIDETVMGQMWSFYRDGNVVGKLGTDVTRASLTAMREKMNTNLVPMDGRNLAICSNLEEGLLNVDNVVTADKVGDEGSKLRSGSLGELYGLQTVMTQVAPQIATGNTSDGGQVDNGAGYPAGTTTLTVDTFSAAVLAGTWCTIAGDMTPQRITAATGTPCTSITISPGLQYAVADEAVITDFTPGAINLGAGYAIDYAKTLVTNGFSVAPKVGQLISFGASAANLYGALSTPTTTALNVNDALRVALTNGDVVGIGPSGNYGFGFHRNAISLVVRPMATPIEGTGARSAVVNYNGLALRVTVSYSGVKQGHIVTVDLLYGVKVLDTSLGTIMLG